MPAPYYDRFENQEDVKRWAKLQFRPGRVVQSAELNEVQSTIYYYMKRLGLTIFKEGDVISGCVPYRTDASRPTLWSVGSGHIFVDGAIRFVADSTDSFNLTAAAEHELGLIRRDITQTYVQDSDLLDPAEDFDNFSQPGADRRIYVYRWAADQQDSTLWTPVHTVVNNNLKVKVTGGTQYSTLMDTIAKRTQEISGSFTIREFNVVFLDDDTSASKVKAIVSDGIAYIDGYRYEQGGDRFMRINRSRDVDQVVGDLHTYSTLTDLYELSNDFVKRVAQLVATVITTQQLTKGPVDGADAVAFTPMTQIVAVNQGGAWDPVSETFIGGTTYTQGIDYQKLGNTYIDWSLGGTEPSAGTTYNAAYKYRKVMSPGTRTKTRITDELVSRGPDLDPPTGLDATTVGQTLGTYYYRITARTELGESLPGTRITVNAGSPGIDSTSYVRLSWDHNANEYDYRIYRGTISGFETLLAVVVAATDSTKYTDNGAVSPDGVTTVPARNTTLRDELANGDLIDIIKINDVPGQSEPDHAKDHDYILIEGNDPFDTNVPKYNYSTEIGTGVIDWWEGRNIPSPGESYYATYDYWSHDVEGDYVHAGSYDSYDDIGAYNLGNFKLRNQVDFRTTTGDRPYPNTDFDVDFEFYLAKYVMIYMRSDGNISFEESSPDIFPAYPEEKVNALNIGYALFFPYTSDIEDDIQWEAKTHKRYTMEDIRRIERRLENVEYFQLLDILENEANAEWSTASKKGIFTDAFTGSGRSDLFYNDGTNVFNIAFDQETQAIRLPFTMDATSIEEDLALTTARVGRRTLMLPFSEAVFAQQPYATRFITVQPYEVFEWSGYLELTPEQDNWVETSYAPRIIIDMTDENAHVIDLGTVWNSWQTVGTGAWRFYRNVTEQNMGTGILTTTETRRRRTEEQLRSGQRTTLVPETRYDKVSEAVINVDIVPFIRASTIHLKGYSLRGDVDGLKVYFDNVLMDSTNLSNHNPVPTNLNRVKTDATGVFHVDLWIPPATFTVGRKIVQAFFDDNTIEKTSCSAAYEARGIHQTKQETYRAVTVYNQRIETVNQNRAVVRDQQVSVETDWEEFWDPGDNGGGEGDDPLAQSFVTPNRLIYISTIRVFFRSKGNQPVTITIRDMVNGYPGREIIAEKTLNPGEVATSTDGQTGTDFTFFDPVLLNPSIEYCFVIFSADPRYEVWYATLGEDDVNSGAKVMKNPYSGVMFSSANQHTWQADGYSDIKFVIYECNFENQGQIYWKNITGAQASVIMLNAMTILPEGADMKFFYSVDGGSTWLTISPFINSEQLTLVTQCTLRCDMSSIISSASPMIGRDRNSFIFVLYDETGNYFAANTNLGTASNNFRVWFDAALPSGVNVQVYYTTDNGTTWTEMTNPTTTTIDAKWTEYKYEDTGVADFTQFRIWLKLSTTNRALSPVVRKLRAIAY